MLRILFGVFIGLHGLVHILYFGQARRLFELQAGMVWPDGSWAFSGLLGEAGTRTLASLACVVAAIAFVAGGTGSFARLSWWRPVIVGAAVFSTLLYLFFWDGKLHRLDNQGGVAILINAAILAAVLIPAAASWLGLSWGH